MKILVIGLIDSQWTKNFVEICLLKNNYEVWMIKISNKREDRKYISTYKKNGVHFIDCTKAVIAINDGEAERNDIKLLFGHLLQIRTILKAGDFDLINLQYVDGYYMFYGAILKYINRAKLIFSYWGSDLLRTDNKQLRLREVFVRQADFFTFDNRDLEIKFNEIYKCASKIPSETVLFGLPILDIINEKFESKSHKDLRESWNIPIDSTVVAVGYNGGPAQQHIKVLNAISNMDIKYKENIFILLQMTYGGTNEYIRRVISTVKRTGCKYRVIQDFLSDDEVAELRIMTDIFINAQTTDAFSGSVCENLFAGTKLINAEWLRYQEFNENDFKYLEFKNFNEIGLLIKSLMEQPFDTSINKELVWRLRSWEYCAPKWKKVFNRLMRQKNRKRGLTGCKKQQ